MCKVQINTTKAICKHLVLLFIDFLLARRTDIKIQKRSANYTKYIKIYFKKNTVAEKMVVDVAGMMLLKAELNSTYRILA